MTSVVTCLQKCISFLPPAARWRWAGLIPLTLVTVVLETIGFAAVFALITILDDPPQVATLPVIATIYAHLPWQEEKTVILTFTVLVAVFYILKNSLVITVAYAQSMVASLSVADFSQHMLKGYLTVPYAFYFQRNSAELIRNLNDSVTLTFRTVLGAAVSGVTETLVVVGIVTVLILTAPLVTLSTIAVLAGLFALLFKVTLPRFTQWGVQEHMLRKDILQALQQILGGLKEIKVMGRERFFYETFCRLQNKLAHTLHLYQSLSGIPHILVETVFICGILLVVMLVTVQDRIRTDILPLLGLYAYAGFRIIPSSNRILMRLNSIRHGTAAVDQLYDDFIIFQRRSSLDFDPGAGQELTFTHSIGLDQVSYTYDGTNAAVLQAITLTIRRGESIGIVGPTGAGKSTLIDLILGLLQPTTGRITIDGKDIASHVRAWQHKVGYVPQRIYLIDESLHRNIAFGLTDAEIDEQQVQAALRLAQLQEFVASLPHGLDTLVGERGIRLSGGQQQRVAIARALYSEPEVLIFDEATSALDSQTERELTQAITSLQGEKTLIIIAHRLSTVQHCDRLVFLQAGQVVDSGSFNDLFERSAAFRQLTTLTADESVSQS